ncbi:Rv2732c family membrane protein, partial [Corynebacterium stationis]
MSKQQENPIQAERRSARTMDLRNQVIPLIVAVVFYVAWLILPHSAGIRGFEIITFSSDARETMSIAEFVFAILATLGVGVCTTLTLVTRRAIFGLIGWMLVTVGFA